MYSKLLCGKCNNSIVSLCIRPRLAFSASLQRSSLFTQTPTTKSESVLLRKFEPHVLHSFVRTIIKGQ